MAVQYDNDGGLTAKNLTATGTATAASLVLGTTNITNPLLAKTATSSGTAVGTVAAAGSAQGDATAIASDFCVVTAADGTKGVILPTATIGLRVLVKNNTNAILKVYPATGAAINALSANAAISMAAFTCATFAAQTATQWFTSPLLPS